MVSSTRGVRITGEERQQLMLSYVRRYQAGESIRSLAADTNRSYGFVQGLLKEAGVPLRSRGGATRGAEAEADRKERQARVEAVRTAERADLAAEAPAQDVEPAEPDTSVGPVERAARVDDEASVVPAVRVLPGSAVVQADTEMRDLRRSPTSPADWGLPTPPLGVLVPKKDTAKAKAKRIAAKKAKSGGGPRHLRELVAARDAADRDEETVPAPEPGKKGKKKDAADKKAKDKKDKAKKDKGKKDKGKKDKGKKDKGKKAKSAKGGAGGPGRSQKPTP